MTSFDELVAEAAAAPFTGWDFSWLDARSSTTALPWSYDAEVAALSAHATTLLDLGTGGGEWLSRLNPRPARTVATECWPPNVGVAADTLRPLGVPVVQCDGAPDNMSAAAVRPGQAGLLPFRERAFDLVVSRHEAFRADEVNRVLTKRGTFVTQQVDYHSDDDLHELLGLDPPETAASWLPLATRQLTSAGLVVRTAIAGESIMRFDHIGAVVYYLKVLGWAVPQYRLDAFLPRLREAWQAADAWPLSVCQRRFLVVATKPGD
jgi:hypothetical protein